jgi:hypothetical protein
MSDVDPTAGQKAKSDPNCPYANSGAVYMVLDAPAAKDGEPPPDPSSLPKNFRSMTDDWHKPGKGNPPSKVGLATLNASGSAQYCKGQLQAMLSTKSVTLPMTIVDLRSSG